MSQTLTPSKTLDISWIRSQFPALSDDYVLMDNAGGSQACIQVIDRVKEYFLNYNVQLGASYKHSAAADQQFEHIHQELATMINASRPEEVICGPSTTALLRVMSICLSRKWKKGDEVIVTNSDHEANVSCWMDLQEQGINVKIWKLNMDTLQFELDDLKALISDKTKLVAMVHASNLLGTINPIAEVAEVVHQADAYLCVDGVAYAPHRLIDVKKWDVDFYVFSTYKTYGPHQSIMYGRYEIISELRGLNHYFINQSPYKFQLGNFNFELTYAMLGIKKYLEGICNTHHPQIDGDRNKLAAAFNLIADHEECLSKELLNFLNSKPGVKIIGIKDHDKSVRVPTISFIHGSRYSVEIVHKVDPHNIGIRYGDFYTKKLVNDLGLNEGDGVVRVSMVHYNTIEEVERLMAVLDPIL